MVQSLHFHWCLAVRVLEKMTTLSKMVEGVVEPGYFPGVMPGEDDDVQYLHQEYITFGNGPVVSVTLQPLQ